MARALGRRSTKFFVSFVSLVCKISNFHQIKVTDGSLRLSLSKANREAEWDKEKTEANEVNEEFIPIYVPLFTVQAEMPINASCLKNSPPWSGAGQNALPLFPVYDRL